MLHNRNNSLKIFTDDLKNQIHNNCNDDLEICYGKFIGPIKALNKNSFFFVSVFEPGKKNFNWDLINITDFTYINLEKESIFGHFFALFPLNTSDLNSLNNIKINNQDSTQKIDNLKKLKSIGQRIDKIMLFNSKDKGYLIKYNQGGICDNNMCN